jgi:hypothetical protein
MNHLAIYRLYPQVMVIDGNNFLDAQGNQVTIDMDAVNAWVDPDAYKAQRASEYPAIGDQLDALWKGGDDAAAMLALVQAVKAKYPKGTE